MVKKTIVFIVFLAVIIAVFSLLPFLIDYNTSVIPGWNTNIYPLEFPMIFGGIWFLGVVGIYSLILRKKNLFSLTQFKEYLFLSVPFFLLGLVMLSVISIDSDNLALLYKVGILYLPYIISQPLFILGQLYFIFQVIKNMRKNSM